MMIEVFCLFVQCRKPVVVFCSINAQYSWGGVSSGASYDEAVVATKLLQWYFALLMQVQRPFVAVVTLADARHRRTRSQAGY
jgi:hypothetical protein